MKNTAAAPTTTPKALEIWTYEDRANPRRAFVLVETITDRWGTQYRLLNLDTDESITSDLRQIGWTKVGTWAA